MKRVDFRLLGPVGLWRGERRLGPATAQQRTVLALLLLDVDVVVPVSKMTAALWSTAPPASARNAMQGYVARLRRLLAEAYPGGELTRVGAGYRLSVDRADVDLHRFRALTAGAGEAGRAPDGAALGAALGLWRGPALADVAGEWLPSVLRPALEAERLAAAEVLLAADLERGDREPPLAALSALVAEHPLRERSVALLMAGLHRSGRTAEALALFRQTRRRLVGELGIEPGEDLTALHRSILGGRTGPPARNPVRDAQSVPHRTPAVPDDVVPHQVPAAPPGFVGRRDALSFLDSQCAASGIATIVGPPGAGKTSLVVHWAQRNREMYPDGQLFVDMRGFHPGPSRSAADALALLLVTLGVPAERIRVELDAQVALFRSVLAGRRVLLVLDNVADAEQVRPLVPGTAGCLVLVTSRDRLSGLVARDGARRFTLDVLPEDDAVAVLAASAGPDRVAGDLPAARELARVCGQLPLALRIAGARLADRAHLSVRGYVEELTARGPLSQLRADTDDRAAVRAAFDLSYRTLPPAAARLFRLLGAAPAPAGLAIPAVRALAGAAEEHIEALARLHLVRVTEGARLTAHDLLLEYAGQLAGEHDDRADRDAAVHRLSHFYLHAADRATAVLNGPSGLGLPRDPLPDGVPVVDFVDQAAAHSWLAAEWPNLVAVMGHAAATGHHRVAWQLAHALREVMRLHAVPAQWRQIAETGLAAARRDGDPRGEAVMRQSLGLFGWYTGDMRAAQAAYVAAAVLARRAGWREGESAACCNIGTTLAQLGHPRAAIRRFQRSLAIDREIDDRRAEAASLTNLAAAYEAVGDLVRAVECGELALPLLRATGQHQGAAIASDNLATVRRELGRLDDARRAAQEALQHSRAIGASREEASALTALGRVDGEAGRYAEAEKALRAALEILQPVSDGRLEASARIGLAEVHLRRARLSEAAGELDLVMSIVESTGDERARVDALLLLADLCAARLDHRAALERASQAEAAARAGGYALVVGQALRRIAAARLGLADATGCLADGRRALSVQRRSGQRLAYAHSLVVLGHAYQGLGRPSLAQARWRAAHAVFEASGAAERDDVAALLNGPD